MSAYRSILPQRTRSIEPADLKAAPNLSVYVNNLPLSGSDEAGIDVWDRSIPFLPQTLLKLYEEAFETSIKVKIHFLNKNKEGASKDFLVLSVGRGCLPGQKIYSEDFSGRLIFLNGRTLDNDGSTFKVAPDSQGKGLGKAWLKSMVELLLALGDEDLKFQAGLENGAYTWARVGVPMDMAPQDAEARTNLSRMVIGRLEAVRPFLSPSDYHMARALSRFVAKDDINRLASMEAAVPHDVLDDLHQEDSSVYKRLTEFYALHPAVNDPKMLERTEKNHLSAAFHSAARQERELSLPRFLLSHAYWNARIDFSNACEMQTIGAYLGGWKTIMPTSRDHDPALQL